jgi:putative spermidine/putrescine transport system permease protein
MRRLGIAWTVVLALGLLAPLLVAMAGAFSGSEFYGQRSEGAMVQSSADLFRYVLGLWGSALLRSARLVAVVVPLALAIGAPAAWAFRHHPFPGARLLEAAALVPLSIPGIALAVGLILGPGGRPGAVPRFGLLVLGHLAYTVPLVLKTVGNAAANVDPGLLAAARTLGAGRAAVVRRIVLPLLAPSLVLAAFLVFTVSWGEFNVSFLLATPLEQTFPAALYLTYTTNSFPVAAAATIVFLAPVLPALAVIQRLGRALGGEELHRGVQA